MAIDWRIWLGVVGLLSTAGCSVLTDLSDLSRDEPEPWLKTSGNRILWWDGEPFRGRGANLHDTRSCWECSWQEPNPREVERRMDLLIDDWNANLVRLVLESYGPDSEAVQYGALQWKGVLEDREYLEDLQTIVRHAKGRSRVAVEVSLWIDPTLSDAGLPTDATRAQWELLAETFAEDGYVIFGLIDAPVEEGGAAPDEEIWTAMNETVAAIRAVETRLGVRPHLIGVPGTRDRGADLSYYVEHPITAGDGRNIIYETHIMNSAASLETRFLTPAQDLPVTVAAFAPVEPFTIADCEAVIDAAEAQGIPHVAWTFHTACAPALVAAPANAPQCPVAVPFEPTAWGELVKRRLAAPW